MGMFRTAFMNVAGVHEEPKKGSYEWKKEHMTPQQLARTMDNAEKYNGIPAIPVDIGYHSGKNTGGAQKTGVVSNAASNPGVILGMGLTTAALLGMFKSSFLGDKVGAQKMMQYRIMAQFFTVTALVAGVTIFGATYEDEEHQK
ncbi:HIG1 domain-containing protein [Caenorhabditis elegans]|uniref:HIG1 domain-containing protein n=2 Tax=Caenorhabditis elegans TaxID=6239 RepID=Q21524_CAEEL|nr:HIG1 domain-containing protein [Caenorhabditis elegans]CAA91414.1 HIG1 domain-containing protein [Caenorhabditis elegans]|eukprot:NP_001254151.1 Uncharacterized protein CELE_M05D6.5 [Caenorhabditis elegans]